MNGSMTDRGGAYLMAARANPAAEVAAKMVQTLREQRDQGSAYPLTRKQLAELANPSATEDLKAKAAKHKGFTGAVLLARKKAPDSPLALAGRPRPPGDHPLPLAWVLEPPSTPAAPPHPADNGAEQ